MMSAVHRGVLAAVVHVALMSAPAQAMEPPAAPPEPTVVIESLNYEGPHSEAMEAQVNDRLREGLARAHYQVVDDAGDAPGSTAYAVRAQLSASSRNYRLRLELFDADGVSVAVVVDRCELCGVAEVEEMVADQAAVLGDKLESLVRDQPLLVVDSRPAGAQIELDGELVGSAPLRLGLTAGRHRTRARLPGYFDQELEVDAVAGMRQSVTVQMVEIPPAPTPTSRPNEGLAPWGFASGVAGLAGLGTGIALLVIDQRPYERQCAGADVDPMGNCRLRYDTRTGGIAGVVGGAVLTAVAVTLLAVAYRRRPASRQPIAGARPRWSHAVAVSR